MRTLIKHLQSELLRQRDRWVLWIPVALGIGVGFYFSLHAEPPLWLGLVVLAFLAALLAPFYKSKAAIVAWLPFFLIVIGFTAAQWRTWDLATPMLAYKTKVVTLQGRVTAVDEMPTGFRFALDRIHYEPDPRFPQDPVPTMVRLTTKIHQPPPAVGDVVQMRAVLLPLSSPVEPDAYDFQRHSFFEGMGATGYTLSPNETLSHDESGFFFASLRRYIRTHIEAQIADKDAAAVTAGILIGESKAISNDSWDNIRLAGLAHLLSIAGLHTGVVTGWLFFVVRWVLAAIPAIALRYPVKKISAGISIIGAIFYLCLVNFSLPAERAVIMMCVVMTAIIMDRDPFSLRLLAFAATLILLLRPESLVGGSFQMSFAAVCVLIAFYESTRDGWEKLYQDKRWFMKLFLLILGSVATTGAATLGTAPYSLFHFLRVPIISGFIANLIAVPIVVVITLPVGIVSCFLMPMGLDAVPLKIVGWSVTAILKVADLAAHQPYAAYHTDSWPLPLLVLITFGGLWVCLWRGTIRWIGLVPVLAGFILIPFSPRADVLALNNGKLFAVRAADDTLLLSPGRADKFTRESWTEREGSRGVDTWPDDNEQGNAQVGSPIFCSATSCLYRNKNHLVSFIMDDTALTHDCAGTDIVISGFSIDPATCRVRLLIDKTALKLTGAQAFYFERDGSVTVKSVYAARGDRPWTNPLPVNPEPNIPPPDGGGGD